MKTLSGLNNAVKDIDGVASSDGNTVGDSIKKACLVPVEGLTYDQKGRMFDLAILLSHKEDTVNIDDQDVKTLEFILGKVASATMIGRFKESLS